MVRGALIGLFVTIGLNVGPPINVVGSLFGGLIPGLVGGLIAGFIANRGPLGGLVVGFLIAVLMFFPMLAILTGAAPPDYELMGEFPGIVPVILNIAPTVLSVLVGGFIGALLHDLLPRLKRELGKMRSATARSNYYKR